MSSLDVFVSRLRFRWFVYGSLLRKRRYAYVCYLHAYLYPLDRYHEELPSYIVRNTYRSRALVDGERGRMSVAYRWAYSACRDNSKTPKARRVPREEIAVPANALSAWTFRAEARATVSGLRRGFGTNGTGFWMPTRAATGSATC